MSFPRTVLLSCVNDLHASTDGFLRSLLNLPEHVGCVLVDTLERERLETRVRAIGLHATVLRPTRRRSFAEAVNTGLTYLFERWQHEDLSACSIIVASPDLFFEQEAITLLETALHNDAKLCSVNPVVYRAYREPLLDEQVGEVCRSDDVEQCGIELRSNLFPVIVTDLAKSDRVFTGSRQICTYRASALFSLRTPSGTVYPTWLAGVGEEEFIGLALQQAGWQHRCETRSIVYHAMLGSAPTHPKAPVCHLPYVTHYRYRAWLHWWLFALRLLPVRSLYLAPHQLFLAFLLTVFACLRHPIVSLSRFWFVLWMVPPCLVRRFRHSASL